MAFYGGIIVVGIPFLTCFLIINRGIPTKHQINITVVVGIPFSMVITIYTMNTILLVKNPDVIGK